MTQFTKKVVWRFSRTDHTRQHKSSRVLCWRLMGEISTVTQDETAAFELTSNEKRTYFKMGEWRNQTEKKKKCSRDVEGRIDWTLFKSPGNQPKQKSEAERDWIAWLWLDWNVFIKSAHVPSIKIKSWRCKKKKKLPEGFQLHWPEQAFHFGSSSLVPAAVNNYYMDYRCGGIEEQLES